MTTENGKLQNVDLSARQVVDSALAVYSRMPYADTGRDTDPSFSDFVHAYARQMSNEGKVAYDEKRVGLFVDDMARAYHMDPNTPMSTDYRVHAQKNGGGEDLQRITGAAYAYNAIFIDRTIDNLQDIHNDQDQKTLRDTAMASGKRLEMISGLLGPLVDGPLTRENLVKQLEKNQQMWDRMPKPHKCYPGLVALEQEMAHSFNSAGGAKKIDPANKAQLTDTVKWFADANHIRLTDQEINTVVQGFSNNYLPLHGSETVLQPGKSRAASFTHN